MAPRTSSVQRRPTRSPTCQLTRPTSDPQGRSDRGRPGGTPPRPTARARSGSRSGTVRAMPGSILGTSVRRVEDPELLTGHGSFVANLDVADFAVAAFVRSPLAHARLRGVDVRAARGMPRLIAAFSAEDLALGPFRPFFVLNPDCPRTPLAVGKVRFVGEPVAVVIAETAGAAEDAVEAVEVDYEPLPAVIDPEEALASGAPLQFEELGTNV